MQDEIIACRFSILHVILCDFVVWFVWYISGQPCNVDFLLRHQDCIHGVHIHYVDIGRQGVCDFIQDAVGAIDQVLDEFDTMGGMQPGSSDFNTEDVRNSLEFNPVCYTH